MRRHTRQIGLTLTESITALALLAIGVLCIATVYLERTQAAPAVLLHSKASRLASELAERIETRKAQTVHFENAIGVRCDPEISTKDSQALAVNEVACWQDKVAQTLPNGTGSISHDNTLATPGYLITVSWSQTGGATSSYVLRVDDPLEVTAQAH